MHALRARLSQFLRHYLVALQYATRLPVTGAGAWADFQPGVLRASAVHFPGAGMLVGIAACFAFAVVSLGLPGGPLNTLAAAFGCGLATALLTRGMHEAELAGLADALAANAAPANASAHAGAHGAVALILVLGARLSLIAVIAGESAGGVMAALLAGHVVSRYCPLLIFHGFPQPAAAATDIELPDPLGARARIVSGLWCAAPLLLLGLAGGWISALLAAGASGLATLGMRALLLRQRPDASACGPGATQQVCELAFYLGAAFGLGR